MTEIIKRGPFVVAEPGWKWRTAWEGDIEPSKMETRHLFFTLRMIWNHAMPEAAAVGGPPRRRSFGPRHPDWYLMEAIHAIGAELFTRDDITPWQQQQLEAMAGWFRKRIDVGPATLPANN